MPRPARPDRFVQVEFYDHDFQDDNAPLDLKGPVEATVLSAVGRIIGHQGPYMVLAHVDMNGKPTTIFRILRSCIITTTRLIPED